ncbi:MAG: sirohydrochlorin cobaltochelatase [Lachnospiraceae bacterium]|nr:sirohydrochlorin cobaltochelatase [Lachnospiraceae bacterium]
MKNKWLNLMAAGLLTSIACFGCALPESVPLPEPPEALEGLPEALDAEDEENYETGDASLDDPGNQDEIGERELLVVSFGTSFNDSRRLTIGAIEDALRQAYPDYSVRRAFTSQIIIDHVKKRDGVTIDNVGEALARARKNGVKTLVVQPTHLMDGFEYHDLVEELEENAADFGSVTVGSPLLTEDEDFERVVDAVTTASAPYMDGKTAFCFMGHGTEADSNGIYARLQKLLTEKGFTDHYVGTVEAEPSLEDVLKAVGEKDYDRVVLEPLMVVAGDHANNDMAGEDEDSWKSRFEAAGYEVECILSGLGENEAIREIYVEHAGKAIDEAQSGASKLSGEKAGTEPASHGALQDGDYAVTVDSSSSMFNITACTLHVSQGEMTARMTMGGTGYLYVYPGTGAEAEKAEEKDRIPYEENPDGTHSFTFPVKALDEKIPCAAFSKRREKWYDRDLVFSSASIPEEAFMP